jgi:hypothetical protein
LMLLLGLFVSSAEEGIFHCLPPINYLPLNLQSLVIVCFSRVVFTFFFFFFFSLLPFHLLYIISFISTTNISFF